MWKRGAFPTQRRPVQRELTNSTMEEIDSWFAESDITIGDAADTSERRDLAKRLFYTWRDCFARTCFDLKATDMIRVRGYGAEDLTTITRARAYCVGWVSIASVVVPIRYLPPQYLGEANWFLGMRILRDRATREILLCQDWYHIFRKSPHVLVSIGRIYLNHPRLCLTQLNSNRILALFIRLASYCMNTNNKSGALFLQALEFYFYHSDYYCFVWLQRYGAMFSWYLVTLLSNFTWSARRGLWYAFECTILLILYLVSFILPTDYHRTRITIICWEERYLTFRRPELKPTQREIQSSS